MFLKSLPKSILWARPKSMILMRGWGTERFSSMMFSGWKKRSRDSWVRQSEVGESNQTDSSWEWKIHPAESYIVAGKGIQLKNETIGTVLPMVLKSVWTIWNIPAPCVWTPTAELLNDISTQTKKWISEYIINRRNAVFWICCSTLRSKWAICLECR